MEAQKPAFEKYIFVCENERQTGACCAPEGQYIRALLKAMIQSKGFSKRIRVSRTGCLDVCSQGPNILVVPDYVWYHHVQLDDVQPIVNTVIQSLAKK